MDDQMILSLCEALADVNNTERVMTAANTIVNTAPDMDLRMELMKLVTDYQQQKDSIGMNTSFEALMVNVKKQLSLVYAQGFSLGLSYQQHLFDIALQKAIDIQNAKEQPVSDTESKSQEES